MSNIPPYQPVEGATSFEQMYDLIEFLSAYIEFYHGGWVRLAGFDGQVLEVEMGGNCQGCPISSNTLHGWIEGTVRQFFPNLEQIVSRPAI